MQITCDHKTETSRGYEIISDNGQEVHVWLKTGTFASCTVSIKQNGGRNLPFGKTFHGDDCLMQALEAYKRPAIKSALRSIMYLQTHDTSTSFLAQQETSLPAS